MSFNKHFKLTCYCSACNDPKGSTETASGSDAEAYYTVAVHKELYDKYKGRKIKIAGFDGEFEIQGFHGMKNKQLIDIYVGECEECNCSGSENDDYNQSDVSVDLLSED